MKRKLIPTLLVMIGLVTMSFMPAKDGIVLRLKPQKGAAYKVNTKVSTMNIMDVQGQSMTSTQVYETREKVTVADINSSEVTIEETIEAMKMTVSQMGMSFTYDSEHPEKTSPMIADQVEELTSTLNTPVASVFDVLGNHIDKEESEEENKSTSVIIPLAEGALSVGSTWSTHKTQEISGSIADCEMVYTVTKISKKSVEVDIKGTIQANGESTGEVSGSYEGTASISTATGMIIKSTVKSEVSLTISQQGFTIPLTMHGTTTVSVE